MDTPHLAPDALLSSPLGENNVARPLVLEHPSKHPPELTVLSSHTAVYCHPIASSGVISVAWGSNKNPVTTIPTQCSLEEIEKTPHHGLQLPREGQ